MPWPSEMTAQITGMYGQQYQQMGMMMPSSMLSESMMGGFASRGMATGMPLMQGAAAMMGVDPLSMGFRAASFGWNRMGMGALGAGAMGIGAATGVGMIGMGASFAANQMFQGAQNQMAFNNGMRQSFGFMRGDGTGQGFNRSELTSISHTLQSMTNSYGPGGETMGFGELSRLAQNMGRMGLSTGVQDAKEFSRRFKEMVSTLKTVATELGTSLESAQELLSSARGSGIFKTADQLKFSGAIRNTGLAGNLATSELTAMANVGSRISRQFGGLGGAGAMGGIKALGQVGIATQVGALSEEDIYNATGATGAEGRAAMASEMLQNTGNFLRTSKGRWFLASVSGKDGRLNQDAVNEYMYGGGMGTDRTKQLAHENLRGIGRANFIRNEGRLRGQVMEQMGGLGPAIALMGWAQQRGININDMDDRSMLFAQRHLGMDRGDLDATIKMAQALPDIMKRQRDTARNDEYVQGRAQYNKSRDIRTRLEHIRHGIQEKLQSVGQDLFQSGSDMIESTMNRILGQFETYASRDIEEVGRAARLGGKGASQRFSDRFGSQAGAFGLSAKDIQRSTSAMFAASGYSSGDPSKMQEAMRLRDLTSAANNGAASDESMAYVGANKDSLLQAYATGIAGKKGDDRVGAVAAHLEQQAKKGDKGAQRMLTELRTNPQKAAGIVGAMERELGIEKESGLGASYGKGDMYGGQGGFSSAAEQHFAVGSALSGQDLASGIEQAGLYAQVKANFGILGGTVANAGRSLWSVAKYAWTGKDDGTDFDKNQSAMQDAVITSAIRNTDRGKMNEQLGKLFNDPEASGLIRGLATGRDKESAYRRMANLSGKSDATAEEKTELTALKMTDFGKRYMDMKRTGNTAGIKNLMDEAGKDPSIMKLIEGTGMSEGVLESFAYRVGGALGMQSKIDRDKYASSLAASAGNDLAFMQKEKVGILKQDPKSGEWKLNTSGMTKDGSHAAELAVKLLKKQRSLVSVTDDVAKEGLLEGINKDAQELTSKIDNMSLQEKRAFAKSMAGTEAGDMALDSIGRQQKVEGIRKATGGNAGATAARYLGLNLGKEKEDVLKGMSADQAATFLAKQTGAGEAFTKDMAAALEALKKGASNAGTLLSQAMGGLDDKTREKIARQNKEQEDPLQADIAKNTKEANKYLEIVAKKAAKGDAELIAALAKIGEKNPDKTAGT